MDQMSEVFLTGSAVSIKEAVGGLQQSSWIEFFRREQRRLVGYVRGMVKEAGHFDSEDIVQDVILSIIDKTDISDPIENFSAYVYRSLRNRVVDYLRGKKNHESMDAVLPGDSGLVLSDILEDIRESTSKKLEQKEVGKDLALAMEKLEEKYRNIFIATEIEGYTFQELSDIWEVPIGTLLARKSRAMKKLRELLIQIDPVYYANLLEKGK